MFSRYIDKFDFKSRFRILKGGKVSLVVSAMLVGGLVNIANAADEHISDTRTSGQVYSMDQYNFKNIYIDSTGLINIQGNNPSNFVRALLINQGSGEPIYTIDNQGQIILNVTGVSNSNQAALIHGIYQYTTYGKLINSGTMNITSSLTTPIPSLNTIGIQSFIRASYSNTEAAQIVNSGDLDISSTVKLDISQNSSNFSTQVSSKGIYTPTISGYKPYEGETIYSSVVNSDTIDVKSKLEIEIDEEDLEVGNSSTPIYAEAIGVHTEGVYLGKILNELGSTINSSAEVVVDEKGSVYAYGGVYTQSFGIKIENVIDNSSILNNGTINSKASMTAGSDAEAYSNGIYLDASGFNFVDSSYISSYNLNSTAIANSSDADAYTQAYGINLPKHELKSSAIMNNAKMTVNAESTAFDFSKSEAYGINLKTVTASTIYNAQNASINVTAKSMSDNTSAISEALYIEQLNNTENSQIVNMGNISSTSIAQGNQGNNTSYSYAKGIYINSVLADSINNILNSGTITANAKFNKDSQNYGATSIGVVSQYMYENSILTLDNSGTIEGLINDELDKYGYSVVMQSSASVINSGTLRGNIFLSGSLENSGTVELAYNAMDSYLANIGYFTNKSAGILKIGLKTDGTLDGTQYSQLTTREATFENNSTIDVNVLNSSSNVALLAGNKLNGVVMASDALTINGKLNITDNSALLNFEYETTDTQGETFVNGEDGKINLNVVRAKVPEPTNPSEPNNPTNPTNPSEPNNPTNPSEPSNPTNPSEPSNPTNPSEPNNPSNPNETVKTIEIATKIGGGNQNDQRAAKALEFLYNNNSDIASAFNKLPTDSSVARAVESTTPVTTTSSIGAATQISNGIAGIVTQRQNANISGSGGLNSGDGMFSENNLWIKPFGSIGSQNNKDGINGFDLKTYGLGFGADTEYRDNQRIGLAFFYTNGSIDTNNISQKADLDVYTTLVYGNIPVIDDKTNFLYQAGYSWQKTDTKRDIFTNQTAEAKYTSEVASLDLKLMRDVNVSDNLLLQPLVNTTYRYFKNPNYSENGAGALNLNVDKFTTSELIVGLGTLAHYKLTDSSKLVTSLNVGYDLQNKEQTVTSAFQGASGVKFGTDGIDNGRWSYEAGIGYELDINKTNNINISYDYQAQGSDFSNNVISAKYVLKF
ncbi:autotransporter domain-containing protein [Arcobacter lacus]|uniref:autotransporter family protein n=1 Tax=Arcobacter lacus TaxID=1912876 RepID=UPI0021BB5186|nr:autotransporter domain-containing protein [Arcobacter lacus]MCT7908893.1 autotransporter domain-containing protein [Arcobacter lacus]